MAGRAGAAPTAGMFQMNIEVERDIEHRLPLSVVAIRQLATLKFYSLVLR
jgi:hypothetical protein